MAAGLGQVAGNTGTPRNVIYLRNTDNKILLSINY